MAAESGLAMQVNTSFETATDMQAALKYKNWVIVFRMTVLVPNAPRSKVFLLQQIFGILTAVILKAAE